MKRVLIAVAHGSEDIETVTPIDILRRAGADVVLAATGHNLEVTLAKGTKVVADDYISNQTNHPWDMVVVPGGPGAERLRDDPNLTNILNRQKHQGKWYCGICAAPAVVFQPHGLLTGVVATCYPSYSQQIPNKSKMNDRVVVSHNCITSRAPGTAMEFSLELVKALYGPAKSKEISSQLLFPA